MKRYLICSRDLSVDKCAPQAVLADSEDEALWKYLKSVYSKDDLFRQSVLDLSVNAGFVEQFYLSSEHEQRRFNKTGTIGTEDEVVKSRIKAFFASRPELGDRFFRYMETEDATAINDDVFEYIALKETDFQHGLIAIDPDLAPVVA
jgi:hypothetical protein